jgi:hypothetical protein
MRADAVKVYWWSRGIVPLILYLVCVWKWVVSLTRCPLYRREGTHCPDRVGGRVGPGVVLGVLGKRKTLYICRDSTPDRPVRCLLAVVVNGGGTFYVN